MGNAIVRTICGQLTVNFGSTGSEVCQRYFVNTYQLLVQNVCTMPIMSCRRPTRFTTPHRLLKLGLPVVIFIFCGFSVTPLDATTPKSTFRYRYPSVGRGPDSSPVVRPGPVSPVPTDPFKVEPGVARIDFLALSDVHCCIKTDHYPDMQEKTYLRDSIRSWIAEYNAKVFIMPGDLTGGGMRKIMTISLDGGI